MDQPNVAESSPTTTTPTTTPPSAKPKPPDPLSTKHNLLSSSPVSGNIPSPPKTIPLTSLQPATSAEASTSTSTSSPPQASTAQQNSRPSGSGADSDFPGPLDPAGTSPPPSTRSSKLPSKPQSFLSKMSYVRVDNSFNVPYVYGTTFPHAIRTRRPNISEDDGTFILSHVIRELDKLPLNVSVKKLPMTFWHHPLETWNQRLERKHLPPATSEETVRTFYYNNLKMFRSICAQLKSPGWSFDDRTMQLLPPTDIDKDELFESDGKKVKSLGKRFPYMKHFRVLEKLVENRESGTVQDLNTIMAEMGIDPEDSEEEDNNNNTQDEHRPDADDRTTPQQQQQQQQHYPQASDHANSKGETTRQDDLTQPIPDSHDQYEQFQKQKKGAFSSSSPHNHRPPSLPSDAYDDNHEHETPDTSNDHIIHAHDQHRRDEEILPAPPVQMPRGGIHSMPMPQPPQFIQYKIDPPKRGRRPASQSIQQRHQIPPSHLSQFSSHSRIPPTQHPPLHSYPEEQQQQQQQQSSFHNGNPPPPGYLVPPPPGVLHHQHAPPPHHQFRGPINPPPPQQFPTPIAPMPLGASTAPPTSSVASSNPVLQPRPTVFSSFVLHAKARLRDTPDLSLVLRALFASDSRYLLYQVVRDATSVAADAARTEGRESISPDHMDEILVLVVEIAREIAKENNWPVSQPSMSFTSLVNENENENEDEDDDDNTMDQYEDESEDSININDTDEIGILPVKSATKRKSHFRNDESNKKMKTSETNQVNANDKIRNSANEMQNSDSDSEVSVAQVPDTRGEYNDESDQSAERHSTRDKETLNVAEDNGFDKEPEQHPNNNNNGDAETNASFSGVRGFRTVNSVISRQPETNVSSPPIADSEHGVGQSARKTSRHSSASKHGKRQTRAVTRSSPTPNGIEPDQRTIPRPKSKRKGKY